VSQTFVFRKTVFEIRMYLEPSLKLPKIQGLVLGADKSLTRPTSRCILFDGENIAFNASLVIYINSTNIPQL